MPQREDHGPLPSLSSPGMEHRDVYEEGPRIVSITDSVNNSCAAPSKSGKTDQALTEPLPCRQIPQEEPVSFSRGGIQSGREPSRVIDWGTTTRLAHSTSAAQLGGHQADEGAGASARATWGTSGFKQALAKAAQVRSSMNCVEEGCGMPPGTDPLAWIGLGLHHECGGPYLAHAFVRCCQHYERRRLMRDGSSAGTREDRRW